MSTFQKEKENIKLKLSIIVLNYNGYEDTIECLESLKRTNFHDLDVTIIVIDNGSTNESVSNITKWMINNYEKYSVIDDFESEVMEITLFCSKDNKGFSGGNNIGIILSKRIQEDYILMLNNDTVVDENFLLPLVETAEADKTIGIVGAEIHEYYNHKNFILGGNLSTVKCSGYHLYNTRIANRREVTFTSGCIWLVPLNVIQTCGLLDENYFLYVEDVDYCYRVVQAGFKIICIEDSIIYHKEGQSTIVKPTIIYYNTRNRLYFSSKLKKTKIKILCFYFYFLLTRILKIIKNPSTMKYVKQGYKDYRRNVYGKFQY